MQGHDTPVLQKSTAMVLSWSHIHWENSSDLKYFKVFSIQKNGWKISGATLNTSILQMGKHVKTGVWFIWEMDNLFTPQAEILSLDSKPLWFPRLRSGVVNSWELWGIISSPNFPVILRHHRTVTQTSVNLPGWENIKCGFVTPSFAQLFHWSSPLDSLDLSQLAPKKGLGWEKEGLALMSQV